jgi:hypothetical protein
MWTLIALVARADDAPATPPDPAPSAQPIATDAERLELARVLLEQGDLVGVTLQLDGVRASSGPVADEAAYLRGVTLQRGGSHADALPLFLRLASDPAGARAADARFRAADCYARSGDPATALTYVDGLPPLDDPSDAARVKLSVAAWTLDAELNDRRARRAATRLLGHAPPDLSWFSGRLEGALARSWLEEARAATITSDSRKGARNLAKRAAAIDEAEAHVAAVARAGHPEWILPALLDLGRTYEQTGDDLLALRPEDGPGADLVTDRVETIWTKAHHHYHAGVDLALRVRWGETPDVAALRAARDAVEARIDGL